MYRVVLSCNVCLQRIALFYVEEPEQFAAIQDAELPGGFLCEDCEDRARMTQRLPEVDLFPFLIGEDDENV